MTSLTRPKNLLWLFGLSLLLFSSSAEPQRSRDELGKYLPHISLPAGFKIELYASDIDGARSMVHNQAGTLFVGSRTAGKVYALKDTDGDRRIDRKDIIARELNMPNGVAIHQGDLYVAEVDRIWRYANIEAQLKQSRPVKLKGPVLVTKNLPSDRSHGWKYIAFGPDDLLYVPVGAPCNICKKTNPVYASILRMDRNGDNAEVFASGVRNTVGFDWHPTTGELWFSDNGRDWLGDNSPADELNHAPKKGLHFGYPYCHAGDVADPEFGNERPCANFTKPARKLGPHVASLGIEFYTGKMFPSSYKQQIFIAEHGSWNRKEPSGYRISLVELKGNKAVSYKTFASGWLLNGKPWGRPVDLELLPDGSMLVSDDMADAIYRITYSKP
jgi:glucose/arabinose dehydrogenase